MDEDYEAVNEPVRLNLTEIDLRFKRYSNIIDKKDLSYEELVEKATKMKREFRKKNGTDQIKKSGMKDRAYETYCKELDDHIEEFKDQVKQKKARIKIVKIP